MSTTKQRGRPAIGDAAQTGSERTVAMRKRRAAEGAGELRGVFLDVEGRAALAQIAEAWGLSKTEAIKRALLAAATAETV